MDNFVRIFDTTLRDGEQSPGASMTIEQKLEIAKALDRLGVDIIEAGFPVSSQVQFDAVKTIISEVTRPKIAVLARTVKKDIDAAHEATIGAKNAMLHTFIATSPIHMEHKLKKSPQEVLKMVEESVSYGKKFFSEIEFSAEDASRSDIDFLIEVFKTAIKSGATSINVPDTVGYTTPNEFGEMIKKIKSAIPEFKDSVYLSVHCHNDLGLATANTLAAIESGANQAEVTINGIGERAGNTSLEEVVMTLVTREKILNKKTNIKIENIYPTSRLLTRLTGILPSVSKPIIGDNVFAHESGIHQDGVIKNRETYEIIDPKSIGRDIDNLVLGRHSGINGFKTALNKFGIVFNNDEMLEKAYASFNKLADIKKHVFIDDLLVIWGDLIDKSQSVYNFVYHQITTGSNVIHTATVKLKKGEDEIIKSDYGDGPVDSLFNAIDSIVNIESILTEYVVKGITAGKDSQGEVLVTLDIDGKQYNGKGISTDIIEASGKAYLNAINKYLLLK